MRKLMLLAATMGMVLLVASPGFAQSFTEPNPQVGDTCPPGFAAFGDPGTGLLTCVAPEDQGQLESGALDPAAIPVVGEADGVCVGRGEGDPDCAEALRQGLIDSGELAPDAPPSPAVAPEVAPAPEAPTASTATTTTVLPETGGPSMLLPVGALILGAGILGYAVMRRR